MHMRAILCIGASMIFMDPYSCYRNGRFLEKGQILFGDM